ncbi:hypothetical protein [Yersinia alsatica]|uniref:hypothetical protein n=2 Tax=Yersinia alsatica TaxID=2890317 RepID=UPI000B7386A7|nr:hypothetical protein [Yersinia alsatica]OWF82707.1 hypothetical protein B4903_05000 [Yersinia frederiksenii]
MNVNNKVNKIFYLLIFISSNAISDNFHDNNVCFYSGDNYLEKAGAKKFCVPYYTEDEWLFSQWNNNIASIKIPFNMQVDIFSDFSFTGKSASLYNSANTADLKALGLIADISSYRVLPKKLYPDSKRLVFNYNSNLFPEKYFGYNYYRSRGHSIVLSRESQPTGADAQSSSIFYSHTGQIMTAFIGQGFDRNIYCLHPADLRQDIVSADVAFTYCDFGNPGQRWLPKKIDGKIVLINQGTNTALSLNEEGFYVNLNIKPGAVNHLPSRRRQPSQPTVAVNRDTIWFDEEFIEKLKLYAVRPFLQYKETLESIDESGSRDIIVHHLGELDDVNIYLGGNKRGQNIYYNAETQYLIAYNKSNEEIKLTEASCLSLLNQGLDQDSPIAFTYNRSSYSDNSIEYRCDNGVAYNMSTQRWYFMADQDFHYLVNGDENKVLHFYINEKPQRMNFRGALTGPKLGDHIGQAINFDERKTQGAIFVNNQALGYILDMEKGVCELSTAATNSGTHCGGKNTSWSSTDYNFLNTTLRRFYLPWLLPQIANQLQRKGESASFLQKIETLKGLFADNTNPLADKAALQQSKDLLVEFLLTYNSREYSKLWHQAAYLLNRVDVLIEWGNN